MTPKFCRKVAVIGTTAEIGEIARAASSGNWQQTTETLTAVTNQTISLKCAGGPVLLKLISVVSGGEPAFIGASGSGKGVLIFRRNGVQISQQDLIIVAGVTAVRYPPGSFDFTDLDAPAGTNTYDVILTPDASSDTNMLHCALTAMEL